MKYFNSCPHCKYMLLDEQIEGGICPNCLEMFDEDEIIQITEETAESYRAEEEYKIIEEQERILEDERLALERQREVERVEKAMAITKKEKSVAAYKRITDLNKVYEYDVVAVYDTKTGGTDVNMIAQELKVHAKEGWRLVNSFVNELGKNSRQMGMGGLSTGTNATIDQVILIFERCIADFTKS